MIVLGTIVAALLILGFWAFILWIGARIDAPHLERERLKREFGDGPNG